MASAMRGAVMPRRVADFWDQMTPKHPEEEADRQAAAIAHKDGRVVEVIGEKSEEGSEERGSDEGQGIVAASEGAQERCGSGEQADADGEAIEAIDEVEGVGTGDEPKHGEGKGPPGGGEGMAGHGTDLYIAMKGEDGGDHLADDLHPGLQANDVIEETSGERDQNCRQESPNSGQRRGH